MNAHCMQLHNIQQYRVCHKEVLYQQFTACTDSQEAYLPLVYYDQ
jgi:hypothetical protein